MQKDGNVFTPYTIATTDIDRIRDAYMKIRLNHANARHIVCAWSVSGPRIYENNDYCDDEEHGAGKEILDLMLDNAITCRAIFVVRKCGVRLNNERLPTYIEAVQQMMLQCPENAVTKIKQTINSENDGAHPVSNRSSRVPRTYANITKGTAKSPPSEQGSKAIRGNRGRWRGGSRGGSTRGGRGRHTARNPTQKDPQYSATEKTTYIPLTEAELDGEYKFSEPDNNNAVGATDLLSSLDMDVQ